MHDDWNVFQVLSSETNIPMGRVLNVLHCNIKRARALQKQTVGYNSTYGSVSQEALYRNCVEPLVWMVDGFYWCKFFAHHSNFVHDVHSGYNATIIDGAMEYGSLSPVI